MKLEALHPAWYKGLLQQHSPLSKAFSAGIHRLKIYRTRFPYSREIGPAIGIHRAVEEQGVKPDRHVRQLDGHPLISGREWEVCFVDHQRAEIVVARVSNGA